MLVEGLKVWWGRQRNRYRIRSLKVFLSHFSNQKNNLMLSLQGRRKVWKIGDGGTNNYVCSMQYKSLKNRNHPYITYWHTFRPFLTYPPTTYICQHKYSSTEHHAMFWTLPTQSFCWRNTYMDNPTLSFLLFLPKIPPVAPEIRRPCPWHESRKLRKLRNSKASKRKVGAEQLPRNGLFARQK